MQGSSKLTAVFVFVVIFTLSITAFAQIDQTFDPAPSKTVVAEPDEKSQLVMPDGKIVIWGGILAVSGKPKGQVARINPDGTLDTSFAYCGCHLPYIYGVTPQPDGKLVVSGIDYANKPRAVRLNIDGSLDSGFFTNLTADSGTLRVWAVLPDGKMLGEKIESFAVSSTKNTLIRLNANGSTDSTFTPVGISSGQRVLLLKITDFLVEPDGRFTYTLYSYGTQVAGYMKRRNADGTADSTWEEPSFSFTLQLPIVGFTRLADGSYIVGGKWNSVNGVAQKTFVHILPGGNVDLDFTAPASFTFGGLPRALSNGQVLVTAATDTAGTMKFHLLNANGSEDTTLAEKANAPDMIETEKTAADGGFNTDFASGAATISAVQNRFVLDIADRPVFFGTSTMPAQQFFRLNNDGTQDINFQPKVSESSFVSVIARQDDGKMYVAGDFVQMNGVARKGLARLFANGSVDTGFNPGTGFDSVPTNVAVQPDGKVIVTGTFNTYNGVSRPRIARLFPDGTLDASFAPTDSAVTAVVFQADGKMLLGGNFSTINGVSHVGLARLNTDGSLDAGFNPTVSGGSLTKILPEADGKITISGGFTGVNGFNRSGIVRLNPDGTIDSTFNQGVSSFLLGPHINGGYIVRTNSNNLIRRLNADGSQDAAFTAPVLSFTSLSSDLRISSIVVQTNGKIIVGGHFDKANSVRVTNMIRLTATGALDSSFQPYMTNGEVTKMILQPNSKVIALGSFTSIDGFVRAGIVRLATGEAFNVSQRPHWDFDGDGKSDISVFRPSAGNWYILGSQAGFMAQNFALSGDVMAPADYDGDGITDIGVYRPSDGSWWSINSSTLTLRVNIWGAPNAIPLPADYDGDGKDDLISYTPSNGVWARHGSGGLDSSVQWSIPGDLPVSGDFDGDGKADPTIFRPSDGTWWSSGSASGLTVAQWAIPGDIPVPADYDGDGKTDFAVYRPSDGGWYLQHSNDNGYSAYYWGASTDQPVPGDYDGDGKADIAVWRPSDGMWYILQSTAGYNQAQFGAASDLPVPRSYFP